MIHTDLSQYDLLDAESYNQQVTALKQSVVDALGDEAASQVRAYGFDANYLSDAQTCQSAICYGPGTQLNYVRLASGDCVQIPITVAPSVPHFAPVSTRVLADVRLGTRTPRRRQVPSPHSP